MFLINATRNRNPKSESIRDYFTALGARDAFIRRMLVVGPLLNNLKASTSNFIAEIEIECADVCKSRNI